MNKIFTLATAPLSVDKHLIVTAPMPLQEVDCDTTITITLREKTRSFVLFQRRVQTACLNSLEIFKGVATDALAFDDSNLDIGYAYNESCQERPSKNAFLFHLWTARSSDQLISSFLYKSALDGNIYFEIAPLYPWHFVAPIEMERNYIPYEVFIKNYAPLAKYRVPIEAVNLLLKEFERIMKIAHSNEIRVDDTNQISNQ